MFWCWFRRCLKFVFFFNAWIAYRMVLQIDVINGESKSLQRLFPHLGLQLTLPHRDAVPSHLCQLPLLFLISFFVALDFLLPKINIRLWHSEVLTAFVSMPKASVDKHARSVLTQHNIRMAWQPWIVQPITESLSPQILAHKYLRLRVRRANRGHVLVSLLWCKYVHDAKLLKIWFAYMLLNIFLQLFSCNRIKNCKFANQISKGIQYDCQ